VTRRPDAHAWVWKIVEDTMWQTIQKEGSWTGAPVDHADGFIHLSTHDQAAGTLAKHFTARPGLVLLGIRVDRLPAAQLRWEVSRGGDLFPHLYGELMASQVGRVEALPLDDHGRHVLPELPA
jgi:uncharacterized protein (DUF952 family)